MAYKGTLQFLRYRKHKKDKIRKKEKRGSMYDPHLWDIVLVNAILWNTWYFIPCTVKSPFMKLASFGNLFLESQLF